MDKLVGMAVVGGATLLSIVVALLLEGALLKVILRAVAKAKLSDEERREPAPQESYHELRTLAH